MEPPFADTNQWLATVFEGVFGQVHLGYPGTSRSAGAPKREMDDLDRYLLKQEAPIKVRLAEPLFDSGALTISPVPGRSPHARGFLAGIKQGVEHDTPLLSAAADYVYMREKARTIIGSLSPVDGYDPFSDPQIRDAGMEGMLADFVNSRSPNETAMLIMTKRRQAKMSSDLEFAGPSFAAGRMVGSLADPSNLAGLPALPAAPTLYGTLWYGVRSAGRAAAVSLATDVARSNLGDERVHEGVLDSMLIAGALGGTVGLLHGTFSRRIPGLREADQAPIDHYRGQKYVDPDDAVDRLVARDPAASGVGGFPDVPDEVLAAQAKRMPPRSPDDMIDGSHLGYSLSAAISPGMMAGNLKQLLEQEALASAGGLEKLGLTPMLRLKSSASLYVRQLVEEMVDLAGLRVNKNAVRRVKVSDEDVADGATPGTYEHITPTAQPLESDIARLYRPSMIRALSELQQFWIEARTGKTFANVGDEAGTAILMQGADFFRRKGITFAEFDARVARAMRRGDQDMEGDAISPFVSKAASSVRRHMDILKDRANDPNVDLFGKTMAKQIDKLTKEKAALVARGGSADEIAALEGRLDAINERLAQLRARGVWTNTAASYFPRYHNIQKMTERAAEYVQIVTNYFIRKGVDPAEAAETAKDIHALQVGAVLKPVDVHLKELATGFALMPKSAHARSLEIPDELIEDFLEDSAVLALRHQTSTFGPAIEIMARFGDLEMSRPIKAIEDEYAALHKAAKTTDEKRALAKRRDRDIADVLELRDRLMNVAGAAKDPHEWSSRTIRLAKNYMAWTTMGLSALAQLGDLFRPAITEGLDAVYRHGFRTLMDDSRPLIMQMIKQERRMAGDSLELTLGSKAMAMADMGDTFASRSNFERVANQVTNQFYILNGMNWAVDFTKQWGSISVIGRLNEQIKNYGRLDDAGKERLASLGIDGQMAERIRHHLQMHGSQFNSIRMPNTEAWYDDLTKVGDAEAQRYYRNALQRAINRTVITPGAADRPTWMTKELGGLLAQFKTFGMSSLLRTTMAGLQDNDRKFWSGAAVLVGGAILLNEIRSQLFYGKSTFDKSYLGVLADGVDRSGVLGSVMDINNMLETASSNRLGLRPALGASARPPSPERMASTFAGPSAAKTVEAAQLLGRVMQGDLTARTWRQARGFVPGQNLWFVDPVADVAFPR